MQALDTVASDAPTIRLDDPIGKFDTLATSLQESSSWQHDPGAWLEGCRGGRSDRRAGDSRSRIRCAAAGRPEA